MVFLNHFKVLMSKIIFKNKKYHFDVFLNKKHFEKQPQPHFQTCPKTEPLKTVHRGAGRVHDNFSKTDASNIITTELEKKKKRESKQAIGG